MKKIYVIWGYKETSSFAGIIYGGMTPLLSQENPIDENEIPKLLEKHPEIYKEYDYFVILPTFKK